MTKTTTSTRELIAALGVVFHAAIGTWFAAASVRWVPSELRWFFVGLSVMMYGQGLQALSLSSHLGRLRRRLAASRSRLFLLACAAQLLTGFLFMGAALNLLVKAGTAERRVLGVLVAIGALGWVLLYGQILRGLWSSDGPEFTDAP
jgi:hypothetical protein